ncbi:restriction endonuclease subunit S [Convivina intestini]|uniref:Type I restriction enzyme S subunit n=1 Tax=Convivina intestini TaxID=1505726 RepID=A0A2U1D9D5_9LACO|nr:restriction endonuclease subunit S [Convivina intestini]PVY84296.1 type I restriction enzyme S subunit [Convivina intestini]SDB94006.1 type I restriction enzyme, S subunit [Leuconostocaceae bacterium R-53105]
MTNVRDSDRSYPRIRFNGYSDAWQKRKLGDVSDIKTGSSDLQDADENGKYPFFVRSQNIQRSSKYLFDGEAILIPGEGRLGEIFHYVNGKFDYHQRVYKISGFVTYAVCGKFIYFQLKYGFKRHALKFTVKATVDSLRLPVISNFPVTLPEISEQQKIARLLSNLEVLTTVNQRKVEKYQTLKKALLQRMFVSGGSDIPQIRFNGYSEAWQKRKLGEVARIVGGGTPSTKNQEFWNGDIDWYSPAEINTQIYVNKSQKTITELGLKKSSAQLLPKGTVLFTSRAGIGKTAILSREGTTNQGFQSIIPTLNQLNNYFIFSQTYKLKHYGEINGAGSTFVEVSGKQMAKMPLHVPSITEQTQIGTLFQSLDNLITVNQRKVETYKELKKALLQQMFV